MMKTYKLSKIENFLKENAQSMNLNNHTITRDNSHTAFMNLQATLLIDATISSFQKIQLLNKFLEKGLISKHSVLANLKEHMTYIPKWTMLKEREETEQLPHNIKPTQTLHIMTMETSSISNNE